MKCYTYNDYQKITREMSGCDDLLILALGLLGESVEFLDAMDHIYNPGKEKPLTDAIEDVTKEAGDVLWYAARILDVLEIPFHDWQNSGTTDNFNDSCMKTFRKNFRIVKSAAAVSEHIKKVLGHGHKMSQLMVRDHVSDIVRDLSRILRNIHGDRKLGSTRGMAIAMHVNVEKLRKRYPNGFEDEKSKNRDADDT